MTLNMAVTVPVIQGQLKTLHSVLAVPSRADVPIRTFHLSFRDFLVNPSKEDTNEFWIDERATHERLATRCIQLLSTKTLRKDVCGLKKPGVLLSQIDQQTIDTCLPPEVQYACLYWVHHWGQSSTRITDSHQAYLFLKRHFLHWLEALSLLGKISESVAIISSLQALITVCYAKVYCKGWDMNRVKEYSGSQVVVVMATGTGYSGIAEGMVCIVRELISGPPMDGMGYLYIGIALVRAKVIWLMPRPNPASSSRNNQV